MEATKHDDVQLADPEEFSGRWISSPYRREGEWAEIEMLVLSWGRPCFLVRFEDGETDLWPCHDPSSRYLLDRGDGSGEPDGLPLGGLLVALVAMALIYGGIWLALRALGVA